MIKMEHPQLPKEIDDPPAQLWVLKEDKAVSQSFLPSLLNSQTDDDILVFLVG